MFFSITVTACDNGGNDSTKPISGDFTGNFLGWTGSSDPAHNLELVRVDGQTGAVTTIGGSGFYPALAYGPDGQLYGIGSTLQIINPTNGTTVLVGDFHYQAETYILMSGASFSPDGTLYVIENGGSPQRIFTVDLSNAALAYVGAPTAGIRTLEFASNGTLYASFANLFTLNASDASTIATVGTLGAYVNSLTFGSEAALFGIDLFPSTNIYTVNINTGLATSDTLLGSEGLASMIAEQTPTTASALSLSASAPTSAPSSPQDLDALLAMEKEFKSAQTNMLP